MTLPVHITRYISTLTTVGMLEVVRFAFLEGRNESDEVVVALLMAIEPRLTAIEFDALLDELEGL